MPVIRSQNYPLAPRDYEWDAVAARDRIARWAGGPDKEEVDWGKYRSCFLWYDDDNPKNYGSYKFAYCDIINGGPKVVFRALAAIIAVLNGGRGGANIPESDREGVYREAAKQYRRFDEEPPELKRSISMLENRTIPLEEIEVREEEGKVPVLSGYAVKWDVESVGLPFIEVFRRGAFTDFLESSNIVALWSHDPAKPLASTEAGNLVLRQDGIGLYFEMTPLETSWGKDAIITISNRVVKGMSFGFEAIDDKWSTKDGKSYREILKAKLFEISPTPFPAYQATSVSVREIFKNVGIDFEGLSDILIRAQRGLPLTTADRDLINVSVEVLRSYLPAESRQGPDPAANESKLQGQLALLRRRLELLEKTI